MSWKVWGDASKPVFEGSEADAKACLKGARDEDNYYLQDPEGNEYEYNRFTGEFELL